MTAQQQDIIAVCLAELARRNPNRGLTTATSRRAVTAYVKAQRSADRTLSVTA